MIGIVGFGGYVPRLRLRRASVVEANAWFAPQFAGKAKGTRSLANWDEDTITLAVAAARDCLGTGEDRSHVKTVMLASSTLPFAERMNSGIVAEALTLEDDIETLDITGSQRAALGGLSQAVSRAGSSAGDILLLAADNRKTRPASVSELDVGDGSAALLIGRDRVLAEFLGVGTVSVDFVDHFRQTADEFDYAWEERWVRDEGVMKLVPESVKRALTSSQVAASAIDHFIFPTTLSKLEFQVAKACGVKADAVVDNLASGLGDTGVAHPLLLLARTLETAKAGQHILVSQFGSGAQALIFRVTDAIGSFRPRVGVSGWLERGVEEPSYTKFLSFKGQLQLERGMRGEQDKKTALTTLYRHRKAILGLVAGRCEQTGSVHFPPSRISYTQGAPAQDTQRPYKLADRAASVLSWSAETLSYHPSPPNFYGQIDFQGGGRILMEFTDIAKGEVDSGTQMEIVFRIKDIDNQRGFTRYFWKATPIRRGASTATKAKE